MPVRRMISRICSTYVVQPAHPPDALRTARGPGRRGRPRGSRRRSRRPPCRSCLLRSLLLSLLQILVDRATDARARPMQQHPLIGLREVENVTHLFGGPSPARRATGSPRPGGAAGSSIASPTTRSVSSASSRSSGTPRQSFGNVDQPPGQRIIARPGTTTRGRTHPSSSSMSAENGWLRPSRTPRVFAMLARIRYIHVRSDDRPSNLSSPCRIPSHASPTTSSATACDETYIRAIRSIIAWCCSTSIMNASSSPARRRSTSARSSDDASSAGSVTAQEPSRSPLRSSVPRSARRRRSPRRTPRRLYEVAPRRPRHPPDR